jgi:DNA-binding response OmpR family regulator
MNILIVEDNAKLAQNVSDVLRHEKYLASVANSAEQASAMIRAHSYDLLILDVSLPGLDGITFCSELRTKLGFKGSILMLTARIDLASKVAGLNSGADDYLTKPFHMSELLARIQALLRRDNKSSDEVILSRGLVLNTTRKQVHKLKKDVALTPLEYRLLEFLSLHRGQVQPATEIIASVWGEASEIAMFSDSLKVHIAALRKKLGKDVIVTSKGFGYYID